MRLPPSAIVPMLGRAGVRTFRARWIPARVLWCNFELARELGFAVPDDNRLTPELERALVAAFSLRTGRGAAILYADRYGGTGNVKNLGSGRGGFVRSGVFVKGIGRTPLARTKRTHDHGTGEYRLSSCIKEALFGELDDHLFTAGSARIVAILDQARASLDTDGVLTRWGVVARVGAPFRAGHFVLRSGRLTDRFIRITEACGVLVRHRGRPDLGATMRAILRLHARTAAEQIRWRVLHGAITTSNIGLLGEMLDLDSQSLQARTAPLRAFDRTWQFRSFGSEHVSRALELQLMYAFVVRALGPRRRARLRAEPLPCLFELQRSYETEIIQQLLQATGFRPAVARALHGAAPELARRYCGTLVALMALRNPGPVRVPHTLGNRLGVADVFAVLAHLPRTYFADPQADPRGAIRRLSRIQVSGSPARRTRSHAHAARFIDQLGELYPAIIAAARAQAHLCPGGWRAMQTDICERAEFENAPLTELYAATIHREIARLPLDDHRAVQRFIDHRVARGKRNIEALRRRATLRELQQASVVDGIEIGLRSRDGRRWTIEVRGEPAARNRFFVFTLDGSRWSSVRCCNRDGTWYAAVPACRRYGILEGGFGATRDIPPPATRITPYPFALPDTVSARAVRNRGARSA